MENHLDSPIVNAGCFTAVHQIMRSCVPVTQDGRSYVVRSTDGNKRTRDIAKQWSTEVPVTESTEYLFLNDRELSVIRESTEEFYESSNAASIAAPSARNIPYMVPADELFYFMNPSNRSSEPTSGASSYPSLRCQKPEAVPPHYSNTSKHPLRPSKTRQRSKKSRSVPGLKVSSLPSARKASQSRSRPMNCLPWELRLQNAEKVPMFQALYHNRDVMQRVPYKITNLPEIRHSPLEAKDFLDRFEASSSPSGRMNPRCPQHCQYRPPHHSTTVSKEQAITADTNRPPSARSQLRQLNPVQLLQEQLKILDSHHSELLELTKTKEEVAESRMKRDRRKVVINGPDQVSRMPMLNTFTNQTYDLKSSANSAAGEHSPSRLRDLRGFMTDIYPYLHIPVQAAPTNLDTGHCSNSSERTSAGLNHNLSTTVSQTHKDTGVNPDSRMEDQSSIQLYTRPQPEDSAETLYPTQGSDQESTNANVKGLHQQRKQTTGLVAALQPTSVAQLQTMGQAQIILSTYPQDSANRHLRSQTNNRDVTKKHQTRTQRPSYVSRLDPVSNPAYIPLSLRLPQNSSLPKPKAKSILPHSKLLESGGAQGYVKKDFEADATVAPAPTLLNDKCSYRACHMPIKMQSPMKPFFALSTLSRRLRSGLLDSSFHPHKGANIMSLSVLILWLVVFCWIIERL